ncbi:MAG: hypothetical protein LBQ00_04160 [Syntrophobacterales bacterium]|jgi:tRNA A-37 threonylcarbamoyl transferase component Bud32|nr:hypothetical protein [Syntrophobacterales bacterium]
MKVHIINGTKWRLEDEGLLEILGQVTGNGAVRRGYAVYPYRDGKVFIKAFLEKGLSGFVRNKILPRGKKEFVAGTRLISFGIATPRPLGYGITPNGSYIIQEWIEAENFSSILKKGDGAHLLAGLAGLLKTLKTLQIRHNDLHLENVLVKEGRLFLIDLHKMKIKRFFRLGDEVSNLAHSLVSVYGDMDETEKEAFFRIYGGDEARRPLEKEIGKLAARWFRKKRQRAFDQTSKIEVRGNRLCVADWKGLSLGSLVETIKQDKKVRVERYSDHIRKIYRDKRRLKKAWKSHVVFLYMSLPVVPEPYYLALPEQGQPGYIAMEDLKGKGEELDRYLDRHYDTNSYSERKHFIDSLCGFFDSLFKWGIVHNDVKGCNLFVIGKDAFVFLDVEDFTFDFLTADCMERMFFQLNTTIPKRIVMRDRMRFFVRVTSSLEMDKKALFRKLLYKSAKAEIVYEGISGLVKEKW